MINVGGLAAFAQVGCLFNIETDETEHTNLAATQPDLLKKLTAQVSQSFPYKYTVSTTLLVSHCK